MHLPMLLYVAICGGVWDLRTASFKLMAPLFSAYDHFTYRKLIAQHIADIQCMPDPIIEFSRKVDLYLALLASLGVQWPWMRHT